MDADRRIETALDAPSRTRRRPVRRRASPRRSATPSSRAGTASARASASSVARACGDDDPAASDAAAAAIELLHCASLVHDDLPCFDDAPLRRGAALRPRRLRRAARGADRRRAHRPRLRDPGARRGPAPGAARRPRRPRRPRGRLAVRHRRGPGLGIRADTSASTDYQQAKTGALFAAATVAGAAAAGRRPEPWRLLGECLGEAYQVADDLRDVACRQEEIGKPVGRDADARPAQRRRAARASTGRSRA